MKTLVLFIHPYFEYSTFNTQLVQIYKSHPDVDYRDLYQEYSDMHIAAFKERKRLVNYDKIVFHFPIIWFGMPPLLKLWLDEVLDMRWITEEDCNNPMKGKKALIVVSTGGSAANYHKDGLYNFSIEQYLITLTKSLEINEVEISDFISVYNAKNSSINELAIVQNKINNFLNN